MTTIVKHRKTGNEYILLGINKAGGKINLPSRFLNDLFTQEESEYSTSVTVCDARGNIFIAYIDDLIVTEIDGKKPSEILPEIINPNLERDFQEDEAPEFDSSDRQKSSPSTTVDTGSEFKSDDDEFDDDDDDDEWI